MQQPQGVQPPKAQRERLALAPQAQLSLVGLLPPEGPRQAFPQVPALRPAPQDARAALRLPSSA